MLILIDLKIDLLEMEDHCMRVDSLLIIIIVHINVYKVSMYGSSCALFYEEVSFGHYLQQHSRVPRTTEIILCLWFHRQGVIKYHQFLSQLASIYRGIAIRVSII